MEKGFDPIGLEKIKVSEWLKEDKDNIVIYLDDSIKNSERILLLNKNYFLNPTINDIYKKCILKNNSLLVKETYDSDTYFRNIGFYLDKYNMINNVDFVGALKKSRSFTLKSVDGNSEFINNQLLELSQIGLKPDSSKHDNVSIKKVTIVTKYPNIHPSPNTKFIVTDYSTKKKYSGVVFPQGMSDDKLGKFIRMEVYDKEYKKNLEYNEDVYFDKVIADALYDYSYQWDSPINNYLRLGDSYFESDTYKGYYPRYIDNKLYEREENIDEFIVDYFGLIQKKNLNSVDFIELCKSDLYKYKKFYKDLEKENLEISIKNVKEHITNIDKCFMKYAPRVSNAMSKKVFWRGMDRTYEGQGGVNSEFIVKNFQSISSNMDIANEFSGEECCIFKIRLQTGLPYINMINTTQFKRESEILLPRNIKFKITKESVYHLDYIKGIKMKVYDVRASMVNKNQFKLDTGCDKYNQCMLIPNTINKNMTEVSKQLDVEIYNSKLPKCPKGERRNKNTGKCEKMLNKKPSTKKTIKKCAKFKKNKDPKCNEQAECQWVKNKGCIDK